MTFTTSHPWADRRNLPAVSAIYGLHDGQAPTTPQQSPTPACGAGCPPPGHGRVRPS
jgi:hypothetical protein